MSLPTAIAAIIINPSTEVFNMLDMTNIRYSKNDADQFPDPNKGIVIYLSDHIAYWGTVEQLTNLGIIRAYGSPPIMTETDWLRQCKGRPHRRI